MESICRSILIGMLQRENAFRLFPRSKEESLDISDRYICVYGNLRRMKCKLQALLVWAVCMVSEQIFWLFINFKFQVIKNLLKWHKRET